MIKTYRLSKYTLKNEPFLLLKEYYTQWQKLAWEFYANVPEMVGAGGSATIDIEFDKSYQEDGGIRNHDIESNVSSFEKALESFKRSPNA